MTNIAKTISDYIKHNLDGLKIENDLFAKADTEGVVAIHDPSTRKVLEFIDGTSEYQLNISYKARYKNAAEARSKLDSILNLLEGQKLLDSTDNLVLKLKTVSNVQFLGIDDKNYSIYTCSISVEYRTTLF